MNENRALKGIRSVPVQSIPAHIICYPRHDEDERKVRLRELQAVGVEYILLRGSKFIDGIRIIGKGCTSVAVLAMTSSGLAVVKIRRTDADRKDMFHEVDMLTYVNSFGIGPRLLNYTENFILMEYADGRLIKDWLTNIVQYELDRVRSTLNSLMVQCRLMDRMLIDHGELANASKHVIIRTYDWMPVIVDFETASRTRRVRNLTSICQYLFMDESNLKYIQRVVGPVSLRSLREKLKEYKHRKSEEDFLKIMKICNMHPS
ncbi:MAG: RIO1 family regulatory kinase/ATPase [Candidatus Bathyarchaeia archaeon]